MIEQKMVLLDLGRVLRHSNISDVSLEPVSTVQVIRYGECAASPAPWNSGAYLVGRAIPAHLGVQRCPSVVRVSGPFDLRL